MEKKDRITKYLIPHNKEMLFGELSEDFLRAMGAQGLLNADCNGDGNRTSEDVIRLLQYIAKMIPEI